MHALIIETDAWVVLAIEDVLQTMGYTSFDSAMSASEAARLSAGRRPDLITSAVRLGGACGFEAVRAARAGRDIPFLFVTSTSWVARGQDEHFAVVQKPFSAEKLTQAVACAVASPIDASW